MTNFVMTNFAWNICLLKKEHEGITTVYRLAWAEPSSNPQGNWKRVFWRLYYAKISFDTVLIRE